MRRVKKENQKNGFHIVTLAIQKVTPKMKNDFEKMFYEIENFKNDFVKYIYEQINKIMENDKKLQEVQSKIEEVRASSGKFSKKEEMAKELQDLYYLKGKLLAPYLEKNQPLNSYFLSSQFLKTANKKYNIFLHDDARGNATQDVLSALEKWTKGEGDYLHLHKHRTTNAIRSKRNIAPNGTKRSTMIQFDIKDNEIFAKTWTFSQEYIDKSFKRIKEGKNKATSTYRTFKLHINPKDEFQQELFNNPEFGESKLVRVQKGIKYRYYIQISIKTISPALKRMKFKNGKVAIDNGTETVAVVEKNGDCYIEECSPDTPRVFDKITDLQDYLNRSSKHSNPEWYREDGTICSKKEAKELNLPELKQSNNYKKARERIRGYHAKIARKRKKNNEVTTKRILELGNEFFSEPNNFKAWGMKRCRMSEKAKENHDNGVRKNDWTKQKQDRATAQIPARIKSVCAQLNMPYNEISYFDITKLNHFTGEKNLFATLNSRLTTLVDVEQNKEVINFKETFTTLEHNGKKYLIQRDLYAASKMLFCYTVKEKAVDKKTGKEYMKTVWKFDQKGYTKFFNEIFYPKMEKYILEQIELQRQGFPINGTILGH